MAVASAATAAFLLAACSKSEVASFVTGKTPYHRSYWVLQADTSGSTTPETITGGVYEREMFGALAEAARRQATVYASPIDGNSVANGGWQITGVSLHSTAGGGNAHLAEAVSVKRATSLHPEIRHILLSRLTNGSDILGGLQHVAQLGRDLPSNASKTLVLLTDGALNLAGFGGYDIYTHPPDSPAARRALITQFRREGELPDLSGWHVYLGGIGVGIGDRRTARAVIALWEELIPATGAQLVEINSVLSL